ncbi:DUF6233 domain-containing protein [Streptomyces sp. NPDC003042]
MPVRVHAGDCWDAGKRSSALSSEEARRALARAYPVASAAGPTSPSECWSDRVPGTGYRVPGTGYRVPGTGYRVPGTGYRAAWRDEPCSARDHLSVGCRGPAPCPLRRRDPRPRPGPRRSSEFLRRAGLDPDDIRLDDALLIEWRGGGPAPAVWRPDPGGE